MPDDVNMHDEMRRAFAVFSQINAPFYRVSLPQSQHELFFEKDDMRVIGIRAVEHFISDLST